jgi:Carboxypeptidase regulatory-like domain
MAANFRPGLLLLIPARVAFTALLMLAPGAGAQSIHTDGVVTGLVTDPSGALIPGATVTLHLPSGSPSVDATTTTNARGGFNFANLARGNYILSVDAPGFDALKPRPVALTDANPHATLNLQLKIAVQQAQLNVSGDDPSLDTDPANNRDAVVLKGSDIDALPLDSSQMLLQLQTLAGGANADIYVDGFSGQSLPPRDTIREIRINQNPYSAQNDSAPINGQIQVFTKPGSDKIHGSFWSFGDDSAVNTPNPFALQTPYYVYAVGGQVSGPLHKNKASYSINGQRIGFHTNSAVNAFILDPSLNQISFNQAVPSPTTITGFSPRLDLQAAKNSTVMLRYSFMRNQQVNGGVGQLALASQGFDNTTTTQFLQAQNTQVVNAKMINETRFQYTRTRADQTLQSNDPTILVEGAFTAGGNSLGSFRDNQDRYELQNYVSLSAGKHYINLGGRLRSTRDANYSRANFNGQYIFPTLAAYQLAQQNLAAQDQSLPAQQRTSAGASQYSLTTGDSSAAVVMADEALFLQDDWKVRPNLTLSGGLRFETQNHIADHADWAPRLGLSWGFANDKNKHPRYVLRAGSGIFYTRFPVANILQVARQNGVSQQQSLYTSPQFYCGDTCPPDTSTTLGAQSQPTLYRIANNFHSPYYISTTLGLERQFGKSLTVTTQYVNNRGVHRLLTLNVNAPLPGTYNPADPTSGIRPDGGTQNIYQYSSEGIYNSRRFSTNATIHVDKHLYFFAQYQLHFDKTDAPAGGFPSNQYDIGADYGRSPTDYRHEGTMFGQWTLPRNFTLNGYFHAISGTPFNIVVGQDLNGDGQFNDRPAFATDLTRPSVVATQWGTFDTSPIAGQKIIPFNYGQGAPYYKLNLDVGKSFHFGPPPPASGPPKPAQPNAKTVAKPDGRYTLELSVDAQNVFNHVNPAVPVGTLGSPLFGKPNALAGATFSSANRIVAFEMNLEF